LNNYITSLSTRQKLKQEKNYYTVILIMRLQQNKW